MFHNDWPKRTILIGRYHVSSHRKFSVGSFLSDTKRPSWRNATPINQHRTFLPVIKERTSNAERLHERLLGIVLYLTATPVQTIAPRMRRKLTRYCTVTPRESLRKFPSINRFESELENRAVISKL